MIFGEIDKAFGELNDAWKEIFQDRWDYFSIPEKHIRTTFLAVDELALKYGWVGDWGDFTPAEINEILSDWAEVSDCDEKQEELISSFFIDIYSAQNFRKIQYFIDNWIQNPIFNNRIQIFRDCISALQNPVKSFNPSNLVVPVLISQIDGIIKEMLETEGYKYDIGKKRWISPNGNLERAPERCFGNIIKDKRNCLGDTYFGKLVQTNSRYNFLINGLFQGTQHREKLDNTSIISRHKILHGEIIDYGTLINTLKLFLFLNYLYEFKVSRLTEPDDLDVIDVNLNKLK